MDWSQKSRHNSPSNSSTFSERENDAENSLELNYVRRRFIDTYTIKVERDVPESCVERIRNDDTNLQEIKLEPQFCIVDENDLMEENHRAAGPDVKIKTEVEDTAADESSSNLHHVPFASIDNENLQDEDPLQNEITSELIIKSEHEWSVVGESQDNGNYGHDISEDKGNKIYAESVSEIGRQVDAGCAGDQMSTHTCQICGRVFQNKQVLNNHLNKHKNSEINDNGLFECEVCKKQFQGSFILLRHKKTHLDIRPHKCMQCDKQFKNTKKLNSHINKDHQAVCAVRSSQCSKFFKTISDLEKYLKVYSDVRPFKCDKCSKRYKFKADLINHSKVHNKLTSFKCQECDQMFKTKDNLRSHISRVHAEELFACTQCDKKFTNQIYLSRHNAVHIGQFKCKVCGKMFKKSSNFSQHIKTHSIERPFQCGKCNKSFKFKRILKAHGVVHSKSYNVKCNLCDAKFKCKRHLASHMKYKHSDARPFKCNECEKSFVSKSNLRPHIAGHLNLRQFNSDKCDRSFNSTADLKSHSVVHSDAQVSCL